MSLKRSEVKLVLLQATRGRSQVPNAYAATLTSSETATQTKVTETETETETETLTQAQLESGRPPAAQ